MSWVWLQRTARGAVAETRVRVGGFDDPDEGDPYDVAVSILAHSALLHELVVASVTLVFDTRGQRRLVSEVDNVETL